MSFELAFDPEALREWNRLDASLREQFKKKLAERLIEPRVSAHRLRGSAERCKIKLRAAGYRLVCEVREQRLLVLVLAVGRRDRCRLSPGRSPLNQLHQPSTKPPPLPAVHRPELHGHSRGEPHRLARQQLAAGHLQHLAAIAQPALRRRERGALGRDGAGVRGSRPFSPAGVAQRSAHNRSPHRQRTGHLD